MAPKLGVHFHLAFMLHGSHRAIVRGMNLTLVALEWTSALRGTLLRVTWAVAFTRRLVHLANDFSIIVRSKLCDRHLILYIAVRTLVCSVSLEYGA